MLNKDLNIAMLLDIYGKLLTPSQRECLDYYYNQDFLVAREEAKEEGKAEGKEKGRWESAKEIALNLYKEKMPVEMIAKVTKLTIQQVKDLVGKAAVL